MIALLALFIVLQCLDGWTTYKLLSNGRERNPLVELMIESFGLLGAMVISKGIGIVAGIYVSAFGELWILASMTAFYALVVANNYRQLRK